MLMPVAKTNKQQHNKNKAKQKQFKKDIIMKTHNRNNIAVYWRECPFPLN